MGTAQKNEAGHTALTNYQIDVLKSNFKKHGQARFDSMGAAVEFCKITKITDKQASIIEDLREGEDRSFFVESNDGLGMIRPFERLHKISAAIAKATSKAGEAA